MAKKLFTFTMFLFLCGLILIAASGCEGSSKMDKEAAAKLDAKLKEWNENGTFPVREENPQTKGCLKSWTFKYAKLILIFDGQKAHPVTSRSVLDTIALQWREQYPGNIKPRFILQVIGYKDILDPGNEWGVCKVLKDGTTETHWYATDVM